MTILLLLEDSLKHTVVMACLECLGLEIAT